jgi:fluoride exporter
VLWYIALGSAAGGVGRYLLGGVIQRWSGGTFPLGTLIINITGSFLLGCISRYATDSAAISAEMRAMLTIGVCGGYTTFSTFSYETASLLRDSDYRRAGIYVLSSVIFSVAATLLGFATGGALLSLRRGG